MLGNELETNRKSWDEAIARHNLVKGNIASVIQGGSGFLYQEIKELFPDIMQKTVVQLFCNDGRELLTLLKHGGRGIGVDFSTNAIKLAYETNHVLNCDCTFVCQEVMSWLHEQSHGVADVFFTSLGSLWWVPDLRDYFHNIYRIVSHGGIYIVWDFHPFIYVLDDSLNVTNDYPIIGTKRFHESGIVDYVTDPTKYHFEGRAENAAVKNVFVNPYPVCDFLWGIGEIVEAASNTSWHIQKLIEYTYLLGERYLDSLIEEEGFKFVIREGKPQVPLMFALVLTQDKT